MFTIRCSYERRDNGSYILQTKPWRNGIKPSLLTLSDDEAQVWETLLAFLEFPPKTQKLLLDSLDREIKVRLVTIISNLSQAGYLELDAEFVLDVIEPPDSPPLQKLHLEITHRCNFRCRACYIGPLLLPAGSHHATEGTTEQWIQVIRDAATLGCRYVTVTGGEPFVRKDVLDILDELTKLGILTEINTNASCISPKIAHLLQSMLISSVEVTVYGYDNESSSFYTQLRTGHQATLRGIRNLVENGIPVSAKYFATQQTIDGYQRMQDEIAPLNVPLKLIGYKIHGDLFSGNLPRAGIQVPQMLQTSVEQTSALPCYPSVNGLGIEPDGRIRACPKLAICFGNVFEDGLEQIWLRSEQLRTFRSFWVEYCKKAGYVRGGTKGLCPAANLLSRPKGLNNFRSLWATWLDGESIDVND